MPRSQRQLLQVDRLGSLWGETKRSGADVHYSTSMFSQNGVEL
jgi:hypothetical protein